MKIRKLFAALAAVVMLAQPVLAITIDLQTGSLTIGKDTYSQVNGVTNERYDSGATFHVTSGENPTSNTITVDDGANANIVLDNVNIHASSGSGIDVKEGASATIELVGKNTVKTGNWDAAAIHGGAGENDALTITGSGSLKAESGGNGAGIGTNHNQQLAGDVTIGGNAHVTATSVTGAGIGSGLYRNMSGNITIKENADVNATSGAGAGIGSGYNGYLSGNITIGGNTNVTATSDTGAGIGSGAGDRHTMSGEITIGGKANVTAESDTGAGIGSGVNTEMTGYIAIEGEAKVTVGSKGGAPIGAGERGSSEEGSISYGLYTDVKDTDGTIINAPAAKPSAPAAKPAPASLSRVYDADKTCFVEHWTELSLTLHSKDVDVPEELKKEGDTLVRSVNLTAEGNLPKSFTLGFALGADYAGKTIEIRHVGADGKAAIVRMVADAEGTVTMNAKELGTYVLVEV